MKRAYTITGYITYENGSTNPRYIQLGDSGNPIIQTKTGYRADRVILFEDEGDAYKFLYLFLQDRKRTDIKWEVVEYKVSRMSDTLVGMINESVIGNTFRSELKLGEIKVNWDGKVKVKFYTKRYAKLSGETVLFYSRSN